jgi:lysylphosphatidylglycerol synthetase-like protein (DUF2156 family)
MMAKPQILIFVQGTNSQKAMINNNEDNEELLKQSSYFKYLPLFCVIVFMVSLMSAAIINTQPGMKQFTDLLAFFALGYLIIGIAVQLIRVRK